MIIASERSCSKLLNKNKCQFCKDFFFGTCNLSRGYYSWPFQYWRNYKNVYTTIPYRTSNILGNDKLSRKLHRKSCWSYRTPPSAFEKRILFLICKGPVRRYWKVEDFDYVCFYSKTFWSTLTNKIKNRCKFWRIKSNPLTKLRLVKKTHYGIQCDIRPALYVFSRNDMPRFKKRLSL